MTGSSPEETEVMSKSLNLERSYLGLINKRIVITRAVSQTSEITKWVTSYGAIPVLYPCIEIRQPSDTHELDRALAQAADNRFDWLVVTSTNTVDILTERINTLDLSLEDVKISAIGPKTAQAIEEKIDAYLKSK